jgi:DNA-binding LacI/PurR family transcriptional regulator
MIAKKAGTSRQVVGKVLNGGDVKGCNASEQTRLRVQRIAKELGYRPNMAAQVVARGRFDCITLLRGTGRHSSALPLPMLDGIQVALSERGKHLALFTLADEILTDESALPRIMETKMCDGFLIDYTDHVPPRFNELIEKMAIPVVWINRKLPNDAVYADEVEAGRQLAEYVISLGHRHFPYVDLSHPHEGFSNSHYSAQDREAGYRKAMFEHGLEPVVWRCEKYVVRKDRAQWLYDRIKSYGSRTTAYMGYGGTIEPIAMALSKLGIIVPQQVQVYENRVIPETYFGDLVYWEDPVFHVGKSAVELLLQRIETGKKCESRSVLGRLVDPENTDEYPCIQMSKYS